MLAVSGTIGGSRVTLAVAAVVMALASVLITAGPGVGQQYAQDSPWVDEPADREPPSRVWPAMAYHPLTQRVVLFGGNGSNETWTWDGQVWANVSPHTAGSPCQRTGSASCTSPPARNWAVAAYHAASEKVVLFGVGTGGKDTWNWDGTNWTNVSPELPNSPCKRAGGLTCISPSARNYTAMAGHDASGRLVLFGGVSTTTGQLLGDTWTWDGTTWRQESPSPPNSPPARRGASASYYAASERQHVVLFGGEVVGAPVGENLRNDTWTWDGTTWSEHGGQRPPRRAEASMAFLEETSKTVLFGGRSGPSSSSNDTWEWDGTGWTERLPSQSPSSLSEAGMAYHAPSKRVVLFGGRGPGLFSQPQPGNVGVGSTWTWDGKKTTSGVDTRQRITLKLDPTSIPADGKSTSTATVTVTLGYSGVTGAKVEFVTDRDVVFGPVTDHNDGTYTTTITSSFTAGEETITAKVTSPLVSGNASAKLAESEVPCPPASPTSSPNRWSDLDPAFGCQGKVTAPPGQITDMVLHPDNGKVVAVGVNQLARFNSDGSLDATFGEGGITRLTAPAFWATGVAYQHHEGTLKILVIGSSATSGGGPRYAYQLYRFLSNGFPDPGFGAGGRIQVEEGSGYPSMHGRLTVQEDGKIVRLSSYSERPASTGIWSVDFQIPALGHWKVTRYNVDGSPDDNGPKDSTPGDAFGTTGNGSTTFDVTPGGRIFGGNIALQRDGKIVFAGGQCQFAATNVYWPHCDMAVARLTTAGSLDPDFNPCAQAPPPCGGVVITPFEASGDTMSSAGSSAYDLVIQDDKKIIAAGYGGTAEGHSFAMARYNVGVPNRPDGSLDATFNPCGPSTPPCGGKVLAPVRFEGYQARKEPPFYAATTGAGYAVALQENGKIVMAGHGPCCAADFLVARYNSNGTLDTCNSPGYVRTRFGYNGRANDVGIQRDGKIVAAGFKTDPGDGLSMALARYMGDSDASARDVGGSDSRAFSVLPGAVQVTEPSTGAAEATFKVALDAPACEPVSVAYRTKQESAHDGPDYQGTKGEPVRLSFDAGQQEKPVSVPVLADGEAEINETFSVELSDPRAESQGSPLDPVLFGSSPYRIGSGRSQVTIVDTPPPRPEASVGDVAVPEPFTGQVPAVFTVTLSGRAPEEVKMAFATEDGTAKANADYVPVSGTLTIPKGSASGKVTVQVLGDTLKEPTEDFKLSLSKPENAALAKVTGTGRILDAVPGLSIGDTSVVEGNADTTPAVFTVTNNAPPGQRVSVDYAAEPAAALPQEDFIPTSGSLAFAPEQNFDLVTVDVVADTKDEPDEDFLVRLANASGGAIAREQGQGLIKDDDEPGTESGPAAPLGPRAAAGFAPGSLPPSATVNAGQVQAQTNVQAQTQFNAQSQAQAQLTAQLSHSPATAAQTQSQGALAAERERQKEFQVEVESGEQTSSAKAMGHLASSRQQTVPMAATAVAWAGSIFALTAGLFYKNRTQSKDKRRQLAYIEERPGEPGPQTQDGVIRPRRK